VATASEIGWLLGICFQVSDEIDDAGWNEDERTPGPDLWEGKPSWVVAAALQHASEDQAIEVSRLLYRRREEKTLGDLLELCAHLDVLGAIDATLRVYDRYRTRLLVAVDEADPALRWVSLALLQTIDHRVDRVRRNRGSTGRPG
jgi:geranylgeranyl pyrophosphate synthase